MRDKFKSKWLEVGDHQAIRALIERARAAAAELVAAAEAAEVAHLRLVHRETAQARRSARAD